MLSIFHTNVSQEKFAEVSDRSNDLQPCSSVNYMHSWY